MAHTHTGNHVHYNIYLVLFSSFVILYPSSTQQFGFSCSNIPFFSLIIFKGRNHSLLQGHSYWRSVGGPPLLTASTTFFFSLQYSLSFLIYVLAYLKLPLAFFFIINMKSICSGLYTLYFSLNYVRDKKREKKHKKATTKYGVKWVAMDSFLCFSPCYLAVRLFSCYYRIYIFFICSFILKGFIFRNGNES